MKLVKDAENQAAKKLVEPSQEQVKTKTLL